MEIRISEKEITAGVVAYLNSRGFNLDAANVKIDYTVGRKPAGITATLVEGDVVEQLSEAVATGTTKVGDSQVLGSQTNGTSGNAGVADPAPELPKDPEPAPAEPANVDPAPAEPAAAAPAEEGTSLFK